MEKSTPISNESNEKVKQYNALNEAGTSPFFKPVIQTKLTVNSPGDEYEQEADQVADKVMRIAPDPVQQTFFKPAAFSIHRRCSHCEAEEQQVQRKEKQAEASVTLSTENYINSLSGGKSLDESEKRFFEPRMGREFGNVRLHTDSLADKSASTLNALAYTHGNDIVFRAGQYKPETDAGKKLIAHELTHVVQQNNNTVSREIQRRVIVNPAGQAPYVAGLLNSFCHGVASPSGNTVVSSCSTTGSSNSCDCVCDATSDPVRTYTIEVQPQVATPASRTLWDGTTAIVPMITPWPNTVGGGGSPTITIHSPGGRNTEFGAFDSGGNAFYLPDWRILEHELCGHGRLGQSYAGSTGNRPGHDSTIDTENTIAAEQGPYRMRGHFADRRQGESFFNPIGNQTRIGFTQTNGFHFEAP